MKYPQKYLIVKKDTGLVTFTGVIWVPEVTITPPDDSLILYVDMDSHYQNGWIATWSDESQSWEYTSP